MRKVIGLVSLCLALVFASGVAHGQTVRRIQFEKGKSSAVVKGSTGANGVTYVIRAKSGQKLIVNLTPVSKVGIKVETVGTYGEMVLLREERGGHYEVGLEESGDYTIFIGSTSGKPVTFTMTLQITKLADI